MKILITGGCGFLGANLAAEALRRKLALCVFDNLSRQGSANNVDWLRTQGLSDFRQGDIRNADVVGLTIREFRPDVVFHVAGQVAMTTSIANPRLDFEVNALGTLNVLEAVRQHCPEAIVVYSSTNKVYGDLAWVEYEERETRHVAPKFPAGFPETTPLCFESPYGCSKGAADQYMLDYHRMFNLRTVVFRHSSMYGARQFATFDQGWVGWFCQQALLASQGQLPQGFTTAGSGKQVRDVLYVDDMIDLYYAAVDHIDSARGEVFNIGGGMENSLSIRELLNHLERALNVKLTPRILPERQGDQKVFVADIAKARRLLNWSPKVSALDGLNAMLQWVAAAQ